MPKVKRGAPRTGSMPTMAISSPSTAMVSPASSERPARPVMRQRPTSISAKNSGGPNLKRHLRERRGDDDQRDGRNDAADERADRRDAERGAAAALLGHLVAVDAGDHRGGFARHVDQHRGDRAAIHRAVVDGGQHDEGAGRVELEGQRDQDRGAGGRPEAGQHADQRAEDAADQRESEVLQAQRRRQARHQMLQACPSRALPHIPNAPIGNGTLSQW